MLWPQPRQIEWYVPNVSNRWMKRGAEISLESGMKHSTLASAQRL